MLVLKVFVKSEIYDKCLFVGNIFNDIFFIGYYSFKVIFLKFCCLWKKSICMKG